MTKAEIVTRMEELGFTRQSLAKAIGYRYEYVRNSLAPGAEEPSEKFVKQCERAFSEEERRKDVDVASPDASIWDLVLFSGSEVNTISRAKAAGGYQDLPSLYHDAVMAFAESIIERESAAARGLTVVESDDEASLFWLDMRGGVAAGERISAAVNPDPIPIAKAFPEGCYALRVFGTSMEKEGDPRSIPDGSLIVVRALKNPGYPKQGTIVVYSDGMGSTLKLFGYRKAQPSEAEFADRFGNIPVLSSLNPDFPEIQTMDGGKIDATYVETISA